MSDSSALPDGVPPAHLERFTMQMGIGNEWQHLPDMTEAMDGEYVRYEDYQKILAQVSRAARSGARSDAQPDGFAIRDRYGRKVTARSDGRSADTYREQCDILFPDGAPHAVVPLYAHPVPVEPGPGQWLDIEQKLTLGRVYHLVTGAEDGEPIDWERFHHAAKQASRASRLSVAPDEDRANG